MDGSKARSLPAALAAKLPGATLTRVTVVRVGAALPARISTCVERFRPLRPTHAARLVERVGLTGRSVSFRLAGREFGCDSIAAPRFDPDLLRVRPWCAIAVGRTRHGRLLDPRLSLCSGAHDHTTAFAWIEPLPKARWIVVRDGSRREIYRVVPPLAVRVSTTSEVFLEQSLAVFHVAQYAADGRRLGGASIEAAVAG